MNLIFFLLLFAQYSFAADSCFLSLAGISATTPYYSDHILSKPGSRDAADDRVVVSGADQLVLVLDNLALTNGGSITHLTRVKISSPIVLGCEACTAAVTFDDASIQIVSDNGIHLRAKHSTQPQFPAPAEGDVRNVFVDISQAKKIDGDLLRQNLHEALGLKYKAAFATSRDTFTRGDVAMGQVQVGPEGRLGSALDGALQKAAVIIENNPKYQTEVPKAAIPIAMGDVWHDPTASFSPDEILEVKIQVKEMRYSMGVEFYIYDLSLSNCNGQVILLIHSGTLAKVEVF